MPARIPFGGGACAPPAWSPLGFADLLVPLRPSAEDTEAREGLLRRIRERWDAEDVHFHSSGTAALTRALRPRPGLPGGPVAIPAFACPDVATALIAAERSARFYDVDPGTLAPDLDSLGSAIRRGVRAIVVPYLYGYPAPWDELARMAGAHGIPLIEDAAQGAGGRWRSLRLGGLGDLSVLSFGRGKGWTAGAGGALLLRGGAPRTVDAGTDRGETWNRRSRLATATEIWVRLLPLLAAGHSVAYPLLVRIPGIRIGETRYRPPRPDRGLAPGSASILLRNLEAADAEDAFRRARAAEWRRWIEGLEPPGFRIPDGVPGGTPGHLRLPILFRDGRARTAQDPILRRAGIVGSYPAPLARLAPLPLAPGEDGDLPGARTLARDLLTVPVHSRVSGFPPRLLDRLRSGRSAALPTRTREALPPTHADAHG